PAGGFRGPRGGPGGGGARGRKAARPPPAGLPPPGGALTRGRGLGARGGRPVWPTPPPAPPPARPPAPAGPPGTTPPPSRGGGGGGLRIGVPREHFWERIEDGIEPLVRQALSELERAGARIEEVSIPHMTGALGAILVTEMASVTAWHDRYLKQPERRARYTP